MCVRVHKYKCVLREYFARKQYLFVVVVGLNVHNISRIMHLNRWKRPFAWKKLFLLSRSTYVWAHSHTFWYDIKTFCYTFLCTIQCPMWVKATLLITGTQCKIEKVLWMCELVSVWLFYSSETHRDNGHYHSQQSQAKLYIPLFDKMIVSVRQLSYIDCCFIARKWHSQCCLWILALFLLSLALLSTQQDIVFETLEIYIYVERAYSWASRKTAEKNQHQQIKVEC